ncbi:MAG: thermonuclease family protein, partial [Armatimonadota bacterium]
MKRSLEPATISSWRAGWWAYVRCLAVIALVSGVAFGAQAAPAVVAYWVDGDSVHIRADGRTRSVRLIGIDAPEVSPGSHADRHAR